MCGLLMRHLWPRARMVFVRSDPKRYDGLGGPAELTGFSDPVLSTVCPYLVQRPACACQVGAAQLTPIRVIESSPPMISSLASSGFRAWPTPFRSTDLTRKPYAAASTTLVTPRAL